MNNNARYDRSTNFLELEVNVPRTIVILRDEPLNSPTTLAFSVFCSTVINDMRFKKLRYLYVCVSTC